LGYQVKGTPGAVIQAREGAEGVVQIDLDGRMYDVRAKVMTVSGYSGHADQEGLIRFALCQEEPARRVVLVHGEQVGKEALAVALRRRSLDLGYAMDVTVAQ
jgi:metallo-beta-lactamase family protein